ncbi:MAG: sensor histidine kinase [Rhodospirillales bacterium]|nr:sensor histidine kinase [Rhodospirillales bacterium]
MWPNWKIKPGYSLRRRLMAIILAAVLIATAALFLAARQYGLRAADEAFDRILTASALAIADQVYTAEGELVVDIPYSSLEILSLAPRDRAFYRVVSPNGETLTGYEDLPLPANPVTSTEPTYFDANYRDETMRFVVLGRFLAEPEIQGWAVVQVGQSRIERGELAREITFGALTPILMFMILALLFSWFGIKLALKPLSSIERNLADRSPTDLKPLEMEVPREVRPFVAAINHFLERLEVSFDHMQTFIAGAAHQIRTPLSSLRAQIELATDEKDPEVLRDLLNKAHRNATVTSRLTNQLLSHAMVVHRAGAVPLQKVDLRDVLARVLAEAEYSAQSKGMEFHIDDAGDELRVSGDRVGLREALKNLIENAVKFGPEGSSVDISLRGNAENGMAVVDICDHGPGIPDDQKLNAFERFRRAGRADRGGEGSGLGLAIVQAVADTHGAVSLLDRPGGGLIARLQIHKADRKVS